MNRIETTLLIFAASAGLTHIADAVEPNASALNERLTSIEARLTTIELSLNSELPPASYSDSATREATVGNETGSITYVIKDGDSLGSIAKAHGVERAAVLEANRLSEGQPIYIGETLLIPGVASVQPANDALVNLSSTTPPSNTVKQPEVKKPAPKTQKTVNSGTNSHVVAKGDTLTSIAKAYGTDVRSLKAANGLRSDMINRGQRLKIPSATVSNQSAPAPSQQAAGYQYDNPLLRSDETYGFYKVQKGDNLYALARDFFTTMGELQRLNKLGNSTLIYPGNELIVPTTKYNSFHSTGSMVQR